MSVQQQIPKLQNGMFVKCSLTSGCQLAGKIGEVVSSRYVTNEKWSGWVYQLTNKDLPAPIEIGEIWLEAVPSHIQI